MSLKSTALALLLAASAAPAYTLQPSCLHDSNESAEQAARRKHAVGVARTIHNAQANQPGAASGVYFKREEVVTSPYFQKNASNPVLKNMNFAPDQDVIPGWELTLDVTADGYWFMIKDKTDPCGFAFISNKSGLIYTANPLR
jgi:hypothetical protein